MRNQICGQELSDTSMDMMLIVGCHLRDLTIISQDPEFGEIYAQFGGGETDSASIMRRGFWNKVGSGIATKFWHDAWLGEQATKEVYPRLYLLSSQKEASVEEIFDLILCLGP